MLWPLWQLETFLFAPFLLHTYFPHDPQPLLVVWSTSTNKDRDLMLLQGTLVVFDGSNNALRKEPATYKLLN